MFALSIDANYQILGLSPSCSDLELKKAYRSICLQFHPDKLQNLGPAVTQAGQAKFLRVKTAYESIKNDRGIS
jgi:DnaJ like chaperone protein